MAIVVTKRRLQGFSSLNKIKLFLFCFLLFDLILTFIVLAPRSSQTNNQQVQTQPQTGFPELAQIQQKNLTSFADLSHFFEGLANKKGAEYAFNALKIAQLPPNTDLHLLGHAVGDILYKQQGANGIKICTQDFRNACSHSIVIGLLSEKGEKALPEIALACRQAPGGKGAYTMCFHGLGHGVLAFNGYDFPKSVAMCRKFGTAQYGFREDAECVGGMIMEFISGGGHDHNIWAKQREKYLSFDNPFYLCSGFNLNPGEQERCYNYITPYLFEVAGNFAFPGPQEFKKAFPLCDTISDVSNRQTCYGGFGKEFVPLAQARDIRNISDMNNGQLTSVYSWCALALNSNATAACTEQAMESLYWGGENNPSAATRFCSLIPDSYQQSTCFSNFLSAVSFYVTDPGYRKSLCETFPDNYKSQCRSALL